MKFFASLIVALGLLLPSQAFGVKKPKDVFHFNVTKSMGLYLGLAKAKGVEAPKYKFPRRKNKTIVPYDVYASFHDAYGKARKAFPNLPAIEKKGAADVTPSDVFALCEKIAGNIEGLGKGMQTSPEVENGYESWKGDHRGGGDEIVPGDVITLAKYFNKLSKKLK